MTLLAVTTLYIGTPMGARIIVLVERECLIKGVCGNICNDFRPFLDRVDFNEIDKLISEREGRTVINSLIK